MFLAQRAVSSHAKASVRRFTSLANLQKPTKRAMVSGFTWGLFGWSCTSGIVGGRTGVFEKQSSEGGFRKTYMLTLTSGSWLGLDNMMGLAAGSMFAALKLGRSASVYFLLPSCAYAAFCKLRESPSWSLQLFEFSVIRNQRAEEYKLSDAESGAIDARHQSLLAEAKSINRKTVTPLLDDGAFSTELENCKRIFKQFHVRNMHGEEVLAWEGVLDKDLAMADRALIKASFSVMDPDGRGELSFTEFASGALSACCASRDSKQAQALLNELSFRVLDHDNDGIIEKRTLSCWVETLLKNGVWKCKIDGADATYQDLQNQRDWQEDLEKTTMGLFKNVKTSHDESISLCEYLEMKKKSPWRLPIAVWLKSRLLATPGQSFKLTCFNVGGHGCEWDFIRRKWIFAWHDVAAW
eukprot:TRINITY_DN41776_c0_g1_i1.p1 TRINITY_DN41776_c0_g1~~TRINITY_DN41776_c0_g1_i1.p1  ORF type:complete len:421 (+),score=98.84 TRINITY_DN41776_c0_g1_i1:34-1263(+)